MSEWNLPVLVAHAHGGTMTTSNVQIALERHHIAPPSLKSATASHIKSLPRDKIIPQPLRSSDCLGVQVSEHRQKEGQVYNDDQESGAKIQVDIDRQPNPGQLMRRLEYFPRRQLEDSSRVIWMSATHPSAMYSLHLCK